MTGKECSEGCVYSREGVNSWIHLTFSPPPLENNKQKSLKKVFTIIATTIADDPTTQEGAKHAYCMDWGDCEHCVDENKHCKPLGKTVWKWECMDEQVQQKKQ